MSDRKRTFEDTIDDFLKPVYDPIKDVWMRPRGAAFLNLPEMQGIRDALAFLAERRDLTDFVSPEVAEWAMECF